jgi:hypothetical protein
MGKLDGGCLCGAVRYHCDADPLATANCHCADCQKSTGAAFSTVVVVPSDALEITGETLSVYTTIGDDTHQEARRHFCSACGSQLLTRAAVSPGVVFIKAGTLDDSSLVTPMMDVWCDSKQAWSDHGQRMTLPRSPSAEVMAQLAG